MGKRSGKRKGGKRSDIDWDDLVRAPAAAGGGDAAGGADAGGWHTGPASMALDGDDGGAGPSGAAETAGAMDTAEAGAAGKAARTPKNRKKGKGGRGGRGGGNGGDAMDTSEVPGSGRLGVNKGGGMKLSSKRGSRTTMQLKRKQAKQEKALAFSDKLSARAAGNMSKKQRKASLKAIY